MARDVLLHAPMLRAALALTLVAASGAVANAGVYLGVGIGTAADTNASSPTNEMIALQGNGRSWRLLAGYRFGRFAIEASGEQLPLILNSAGYGDTQLALQAKYSFPLGNNFELFGRGGVQRTYLNTSAQGALNASGNGWLLGAGIEYRLNAVLAGGSIFVDYEHAETSVQNDQPDKYDTKIGMLMLGVTLSL